MNREPGLFTQLVEDGRPALSLTGIALILSGAFAIFLSLRHEFLPQDVAFLGMSAEQLCQVADCRIVRFMFHDRVAFGGSIGAVGVIYLWLAAFPLREGAKWAWWTFAFSGLLGFGSFLTYLGYGYLDSWHGAATLALLPIFIVGLVRTRRIATNEVRGWLVSGGGSAPMLARIGRVGLIATGLGMLAAGSVILVLGSTEVFVAEDLGFMGLTRDALNTMNVRLVPLIAHDRAGFGGGVATTGMLVMLCAWFARPSRGFHQAMMIAGAAGFGCAIGVHFIEGYTNSFHLAPAFAGALLFAVSISLEIAGVRHV